jgi:hypothetical protein
MRHDTPFIGAGLSIGYVDRGRADLDWGDIACALADAAQATKLASETAMRWSYGVMSDQARQAWTGASASRPEVFGGQFVILALTM